MRPIKQDHSLKAVLTAVLGNAFVTALKFAGWMVSLSPSMLAESIHSMADTLNQVLLFVGIRHGEGKPTSLYPFGKGRARYELFFGPAISTGYYELNVSPSGDWNVYQFDDYRAGMREATLSLSPFKMSGTAPVPRVEGLVDLSALNLRLEKPGDVVLGATVVVEYQDGHKEYWALAHKGEKPDFHLRASFTAFL